MIPVVFIHFGECEYASLTLAQAKARGNEVVFLNPPRDALYQYPFSQFYQHLSTNHVYFELACMVRWFVLRDWMLDNGVPDCLYCDTDVLLFANVESEIHSDPYCHAQDFTLSLGTSGHTSYWKREPLEAFCNWMTTTYEVRDDYFREMERIFREMQAQGLAGGVSDMLLLKMFANSDAAKLLGLRVGEMSAVRDGKIWDHNFNASDGFAKEDGHKRIVFINGDPFGHPSHGGFVRFLSLHLQGQAKQWIRNYVTP